MNKINWQFHILIAVLLVIIQTTLFRFIEIHGVSPDLVLIFIVFSANLKGAFKGEIVSFSAGLVEDFLSLSPLGFNSLIKTIIGYVSGKTKGKIFFDPIVMPLIYILAATIFKELLSFFVSLLFLGNISVFFRIPFLIQIGFNLVLTPIVYNYLKKIKIFGDMEREIM